MAPNHHGGKADLPGWVWNRPAYLRKRELNQLRLYLEPKRFPLARVRVFVFSHHDMSESHPLLRRTGLGRVHLNYGWDEGLVSDELHGRDLAQTVLELDGYVLGHRSVLGSSPARGEWISLEYYLRRKIRV